MKCPESIQITKKKTKKKKQKKLEKKDETIVQYLKFQDLGKCLIDYKEIQKFEKIGQGGFGEVFQKFFNERYIKESGLDKILLSNPLVLKRTKLTRKDQ